MSGTENAGNIAGSRFAGASTDPGAEPGAGPRTADDDARRKAARDELVAEAAADFPRIAALADDGYSKQLRAKSAEVSKYMQREEHSKLAGAALLDPNEYVAGLALGLDAKETVTGLFTPSF